MSLYPWTLVLKEEQDSRQTKLAIKIQNWRIDFKPFPLLCLVHAFLNILLLLPFHQCGQNHFIWFNDNSDYIPQPSKSSCLLLDNKNSVCVCIDIHAYTMKQISFCLCPCAPFLNFMPSIIFHSVNEATFPGRKWIILYCSPKSSCVRHIDVSLLSSIYSSSSAKGSSRDFMIETVCQSCVSTEYRTIF